MRLSAIKNKPGMWYLKADKVRPTEVSSKLRFWKRRRIKLCPSMSEKTVIGMVIKAIMFIADTSRLLKVSHCDVFAYSAKLGSSTVPIETAKTPSISS